MIAEGVHSDFEPFEPHLRDGGHLGSHPPHPPPPHHHHHLVDPHLIPLHPHLPPPASGMAGFGGECNEFLRFVKIMCG